MSTGCCYQPAVYIACDDGEWAVENLLSKMWALPKITIFTLEPQVTAPTKIKHSDSKGVEVSVCALQEVTYNSTISYVQCHPGMQFYLRNGDSWSARFYPFVPPGHNDGAVTDLDDVDFYEMDVKTVAGQLTFDWNNNDGQISTLTLEGQSPLEFPTSASSFGPYSDLRYGSCCVNPQPGEIAWPTDGGGEIEIAKWGAAEAAVVAGLPGITTCNDDFASEPVCVLYVKADSTQHIVEWTCDGTNYGAPFLISSQQN